MTLPRIVSLIPSATEIIAFLGLADRLVGRSHECDYPEAVKALPICTEPKFDPHGNSREIHDRVTTLLHSALSVYRVKTEVLEQLQPTHILTQAQCEVCAVSLEEVEQAVDRLTHSQPKVLSLQPNVLADLWDDLERVAAALNVDAANATVALKQRVASCAVAPVTCPTVACIEWVEPLMAAGNWIPELVGIAGGVSLFGTVGQHSPWVSWEAIAAANPDVIIFMPCGFDLQRTRQEAELLKQQAIGLAAVKNQQVYVTDGNQYFNRPGPRLVDSLEILAEILHPELFQFGYEGTGWQRLAWR